MVTLPNKLVKDTGIHSDGLALFRKVKEDILIAIRSVEQDWLSTCKGDPYWLAILDKWCCQVKLRLWENFRPRFSWVSALA